VEPLDDLKEEDYRRAFILLVVRTVSLFVIAIVFIGVFIFSLIKGW
jgi:hypothetical protein